MASCNSILQLFRCGIYRLQSQTFGPPLLLLVLEELDVAVELRLGRLIRTALSERTSPPSFSNSTPEPLRLRSSDASHDMRRQFIH